MDSRDHQNEASENNLVENREWEVLSWYSDLSASTSLRL